MKNEFTSESVTCGHPDKVCDQIADRILDSLLEQDGNSRVACEVTCARDFIHIFGEVTSSAHIDYDAIARRVISEIGYTRSGQGFDADTCRIRVDLHEQSPDIARGIDRRMSSERMNSGAGDQGIWAPTARKLMESNPKQKIGEKGKLRDSVRISSL